MKIGSDERGEGWIEILVEEFAVNDWLVAVEGPRTIWVLYSWGIHEEPLLWHKYVDMLSNILFPFLIS